MFDQLKGKPSYSPLGLYPAHYARIQPIKSPLFILMNPQERDEFRRKAAASHHEPASKQEKQAEQQNSKTLTELFKQNPTLSLKKGVLQHVPNKPFEQGKLKSPSSSKATSTCTTPGEKDEREITDYIMRMPPAQFMSFLNKHLSPAPSTASADSFVHLSSKASSSNGDHFEVRSLPDSMAASPWHSKAASPLISRAPSHLRLTLPTVAEQPLQQDPSEASEGSDTEGMDSDKETVEQSTATLKP